MLYFTHDYTSMTSDKNALLLGAAKLAKKHGVNNMVAVCPVEHDLAYSEDDEKSWAEIRREHEQLALAANKNLTILNTDLVYGPRATHLVHFAAQCVAKGSIPKPFLSEKARFNPLHYSDLATAVKHSMNTMSAGQFAVRGSDEVSMQELVQLIEVASNKGKTPAER